MNFLEAVKSNKLIKRVGWSEFKEIDLIIDIMTKDDILAEDWITNEHYDFQKAICLLIEGKTVNCYDSGRYFFMEGGEIFSYYDKEDDWTTDNFNIKEIKSNKWYTV